MKLPIKISNRVIITCSGSIPILTKASVIRFIFTRKNRSGIKNKNRIKMIREKGRKNMFFLY